MAGIKKANDELRYNVDNEVIVGSADVKALYPSLDVDFTVDKVCEVFYGSEVRVEGVNVEELGLYLSVSLKEGDLMEAGIAQYYPSRRSNRGRPPSITGSVLEEKKEKRFVMETSVGTTRRSCYPYDADRSTEGCPYIYHEELCL